MSIHLFGLCDNDPEGGTPYIMHIWVMMVRVMRITRRYIPDEFV